MMQKNKIKCSSNKRIPRGTTSTVNYTKNSNCTKKKVVLNSTWIAGTRPRNPPPITVCEGMTHASVTACESMPLYLTMRPCAAPDLRFILDDFSSRLFFRLFGAFAISVWCKGEVYDWPNKTCFLIRLMTQFLKESLVRNVIMIIAVMKE